MSDTFFGVSWKEWINRYAMSHTHPVNQLCHSWGIPMILVSLLLILPAFFLPVLWKIVLLLFVFGWILQFVGHIYERKLPEFFHDWRFLFVGLRWWWAKMKGTI